MSSVSVTYRPPKGEMRVCEQYGFTFFDGQPVEIEDTPENHDIIAKLSKNPAYEVSEMGEVAHAEAEEHDEHEHEHDDDSAPSHHRKKRRG